MKTIEALVNPFGKLESDSPDNIEPVCEVDDAVRRAINDDPSVVLTPAQINIYLKYLPEKQKEDWFPSKYLSDLVQSSYKNGGYNNFVIDLEQYSPPALFRFISGSKKRPLEIKVIGNVGDAFGISAEYCNFKIEGNGDETFCSGCENCNIEVTGDVGHSSALHAKHCTYKIGGNAGHNFGMYSSNNTFDIKGEVGAQFGEGSKRCTVNIGGDVTSLCGQCSHDSVYHIKGQAGVGVGSGSDKTKFYLGEVEKSDNNNYRCDVLSFKGRKSTFITSNWDSYWELRRQLKPTEHKLKFDYWNWLKRKLK